MSSPAASAVYPHLAAKEQSGPLVDRSQNRGEWANPVNDPLWAKPITPTTREQYALTSYWLNRRRSK